MSLKKTKYIWMDGKLVAWDDAKIHVLTHALHYGSGVFEGIRCYPTKFGRSIFRGKDHYKRLVQGCSSYYMKLPYTVKELLEATKELIRENEFPGGYVRPIAYYGYSEMGLFPLRNPVNVTIATWEWGAYLGEENFAKGVKCTISSWLRIDPRMLPTQTKATGNYINSILAKLEAVRDGYDEAIMLNMHGNVAEGPGENLFIVKNGTVITPPLSSGCLEGITRDSAIKVARKLEINLKEADITKDMLFNADEAFFTGTAAELTPIREVDGRTIGAGKRGPITEKIQSMFFKIIKGETDEFREWHDLVDE